MDRLNPCAWGVQIAGSQFFYGAKPMLCGRSFRTARALPKFMSEYGDVLLFGFASDCVGAMLGPGLLMLFLREQVSLGGVLEDLSGAFMSGQEIPILIRSDRQSNCALPFIQAGQSLILGGMEYFFACPYCCEQISMVLDTSVKGQIYVEDCEVCCHPIEVRYVVEDDVVCDFEARAVE